ncbi:MAG TPA: ABATE domain-containing protein [Gemmatimonadaceae bacterium]|nr:ABATE domain-containing protein [Gemmatimonadaceae bacterium]
MCPTVDPLPDRASSEELPARPAALFVGNALWLDFVNTRYIERNGPVDVLASFGALVDWLVEAGALTAGDAYAATARWDGTAAGADVLARALVLRDTLYDLAELLATRAARRIEGSQEKGKRERKGAMPEEREHTIPVAMARAVAAINAILRADVRYDEISLTQPPAHGDAGARFERRTHRTDFAPSSLLAPLADSASELLCGGDASRVHLCGNPKCVLYFYDTTRNRRRRFCTPEGCGNRVKAAARYRRSRESAAKLNVQP